MNYKVTKIATLTITLITTTTHLFGAAPHDSLKELADSYAHAALQAKHECTRYTQCLQQFDFCEKQCEADRKIFVKMAKKLKKVHDQLAQQVTPEQLTAITTPHNNTPFNLLEPEPLDHFRGVLITQKLTNAYAHATDEINIFTEELNWRTKWNQCTVSNGKTDHNGRLISWNRCVMLKDDIKKEQQKQKKLEPSLRWPLIAEYARLYAPTFYEQHPHIFIPAGRSIPVSSSPSQKPWKILADALRRFAQ